MARGCGLAVFLVMLAVFPARAGGTADTGAAFTLSPFNDLGPNLYKSFIGWNSLLHLAAAGASYGIIYSGLDSTVQNFFHRHDEASFALDPAAATGMLVPVGVSAFYFFYGRASHNRELYGAGCALVQANAADFLYVSLLKAVTGRPHPDNSKATDMGTQSRTFQWGFMRGGIFWGWPSGHTSATMTTAACLANYYPDNWWIKIGGYALTAYTLVGVAAVGNGQMHWFSEGVAGALMSYAVGSTVGKSFRRTVDGKPAEKKSGLEIIPVYGYDYQGIQVGRRF